MNRPIRQLTPDAFAPYGTVLAHDGDGEHFQVQLAEPDAPGWQMAVNDVRQPTVTELMRHPHTRESFQPLEGVACLLVAPPDEPAAWEAFLLDRPVCMHKGVWHNTFRLSNRAALVVCENATVTGELYGLSAPVGAGVG